jgi:hypothetical protein
MEEAPNPRFSDWGAVSDGLASGKGLAPLDVIGPPRSRGSRTGRR